MTYLAVVLAPLGLAMSIPFAMSYDGQPSTDPATVAGYGPWLWALLVTIASVVLAFTSRRRERQRRSREGRSLSTFAYWMAVVAACAWLLNACVLVGAGL
jgi:hypothetical protein